MKDISRRATCVPGPAGFGVCGGRRGWRAIQLFIVHHPKPYYLSRFWGPPVRSQGRSSSGFLSQAAIGAGVIHKAFSPIYLLIGVDCQLRLQPEWQLEHLPMTVPCGRGVLTA